MALDSKTRNRPTPPPTSIVWAAAVIVVAIVTAATILDLAGKSLSDMLTVLVLAVLPILTAFGTWINATLGRVNDQTNGNMGALQNSVIESNRLLTALVAQSPALPDPTIVPTTPEQL